MEGLNNGTQNLFSVTDSLIFQNGSDDGELFGYNSSASRNSSNHADWMDNFGGILPTSNVPRRHEKIGEIMRRELKWAFILHAYGFGCLFFILAFYTFFSVLNLRSFISSRPFMSTINGFLCLLGTTRAGSLIIDPYSLSENMPRIIGKILWDMGFPSIISAFCLVQLAFLQLTQLQIGPEGLRRKSCLSLIVTAHFILTIGMDIVVACHENLLIVKQVIQYIFLTWGVFLCCNFLYSGYKVMAMIRNLPGGLKHREFPDPSYKGIMQLAILAPHNNLAGSVTAALLPTLCAPKIHQQDNTSLSTVGFRNDGNSRILESESIPMLEELAGTSCDEKNPSPLTRGSSFQNQTKNTQKFNLKPKLSLRSVSDEDVRCEVMMTQSRNPSPKSSKSINPRTQSPRLPSFKSIQSNGGSFRNASENFVTTKSICEFKPKINNQRMSFENENFQFASRRKSKTQDNSSGAKSSSASADKRSASSDRLIPNILISCPDANEEEEEKKKKERENSLSLVMNEIKNDLKEMEMNRGERKNEGTEELVQIHGENAGRSEKFRPMSEIRGRSKSFQEKESCGSRRGSQVLECRRNSCRKENIHRGDSRESDSSSTLMEITKFDATPEASSNVRERRESNSSSSWKKKNRSGEKKGQEEEEEESAAQECLPSQMNVADVSLRSVLNHIAYMNRGQQTNAATEDDLEKVRKSKVEWVLNITYITAMWGLMLCLSNMGRIYSPFGVTETRKMLTSPSTSSNSTYLRNHDEAMRGEETESEILFSPWPWLWFQTFCRALELAMGCAMANITRQPAANYRYPRSLTLRQRNNFYGI